MFPVIGLNVKFRVTGLDKNIFSLFSKSKVEHEYIFHSFFLALSLSRLTFLFMINKQTQSFLRPVKLEEREASAPPYNLARQNVTFFDKSAFRVGTTEVHFSFPSYLLFLPFNQ